MAINLYYKTMQQISTSYIYGQDILPKYIVMIYRKEYLTFSTKKKHHDETHENWAMGKKDI